MWKFTGPAEACYTDTLRELRARGHQDLDAGPEPPTLVTGVGGGSPFKAEEEAVLEVFSPDSVLTPEL